jgi:hypothetical protein
MRYPFAFLTFFVSLVTNLAWAECDFESATVAATNYAQFKTGDGLYKVFMGVKLLRAGKSPLNQGALFYAPITLIPYEFPNMPVVGNLFISEDKNGKCALGEYEISADVYESPSRQLSPAAK